jgi:hypothetical protein
LKFTFDKSSSCFFLSISSCKKFRSILYSPSMTFVITVYLIIFKIDVMIVTESTKRLNKGIKLKALFSSNVNVANKVMKKITNSIRDVIILLAIWSRKNLNCELYSILRYSRSKKCSATINVSWCSFVFTLRVRGYGLQYHYLNMPVYRILYFIVVVVLCECVSAVFL